MKKWFALYTRSGTEKKVSVLLTKRKIENYLPLNRIINEHDSSKIEYRILFESFVFVRLQADELKLAQNINDVINLIYWIGKPAEFSDFEIESIRKFLNQHYNIRLEKIDVDTGKPLSFNSDLASSRSNIRLELRSMGFNLIADTHIFNPLLFEETGKIIELVL